MDAIEVRGPSQDRFDEVLTREALSLVARLQREFDATRRELLEQRATRQAELDAGGSLDFLGATRDVRDGDWSVPPAPQDLQDRRVEITGPTDRKMIINALNSGACGFMADFEDSNSPTWSNMIGGQVNLLDAVRGSIEYQSPDGRRYELGEETATLLIRPRGWHLPERHLVLDGSPVAGAFVDFGLFFVHNARELLERGSGPYVYLPKLESHLEARLWNDVFCVAQEALGLPRGTVRATVLIETLPAVFEMDEILHELGDHAAGLNAGRWDYIFSAIKRFRTRPDYVLPDRAAVTMTVPFMRAYTELLVKTCHRRGAHAMGGMSAVIPSRSDEAATEKAYAVVRDDKRREVEDGFDGTWVAHPDSVPVALEAFVEALDDAPNQLSRRRDDVAVSPAQLLDIAATPGNITDEGLRGNINVAIQYISSWLRGNGAAAIYGMMEDAATAEIARAQVWQWVHHEAQLEDGRTVTADLVRELARSELEHVRAEIADDDWFYSEGRPDLSRELFERVALADDFVEFLTLPAYERLDA